MKKLILELSVIIICLLILDVVIFFVGGKFVNHFKEKQNISDFNTLCYNLNGADEDIVIVGSSTMKCAIIPQILRDSILSTTGEKLSIFNASYFQEGLAYEYAVVKGLIDRKKTGLIIMEIKPYMLKSGGDNNCMHQFRHYNKNVADLLRYNDDKLENILTISNMYCWNSEIVRYAASLFIRNNTDGFMPLYGVLNENTEYERKKDTSTGDSISKLAQYEFEHIILDAKDNNIKVIAVALPNYFETDTSSVAYREICRTLSKHDVPFFDYSNDEEFRNTRLYGGEAFHLNNDGAIVCTKRFYSDFKNQALHK